MKNESSIFHMYLSTFKVSWNNMGGSIFYSKALIVLQTRSSQLVWQSST